MTNRYTNLALASLSPVRKSLTLGRHCRVLSREAGLCAVQYHRTMTLFAAESAL